MQIITGIIALITIILLVVLSLQDRYKANRKSNKFRMDNSLAAEALMRHAAQLAQSERVASYSYYPYTPTFERKALTSIYERLKDEHSDFAAAEWLVDNYYLIINELTELRAMTFKNMPRIVKGDGTGSVRAQRLADELVAHSDANIDEDRIKAFLTAYSEHSPLYMREIRSFRTFLRIALVKAICDACEKLESILDIDRHASQYADLLLETPEEKVIRLAGRIAASPVFIERLLHKLIECSHENAETASAVLRGYLAAEGLEAERMIRDAQNRYSSLTNTTANCIKTLRSISQLRWDDVYEDICLVSNILNNDPVYRQMDKDSRAYYREIIERYSYKYNVSEVRIAKTCINLCQQHEGVEAHVGYYLLSDGRSKLLSSITTTHAHAPGSKLLNFNIYSFAIVSITLLVSGVISLYQYGQSGVVWQGILSFALNTVIIAGVVISVVNKIVSKVTKPVFLPKLDMSEGVPREHMTAVVVPLLLTCGEGVARAVEKLEYHYLSNRTDNLYFVLLGDFPESRQKDDKGDEEIIREGQNAVMRLNSKYERRIFFFMQRPRTYSKGQRRFMGYERKRGALLQLAEYISGALTEEAFLALDDYSPLKGCRYIVTLDADTTPGLDNIPRLIGAMAHPLNAPRIEDERVVFGYGIIQPGVDVSITAVNTRFSLLYSGRKGIEPYTFAVSDVYQDLFDSGTFMGKGIINVRALLLTKKMIREDRILSHDLLEGCLIRSALASDIRMTDGFPQNAISYFARLHRWVRGDWQLLPWLCSIVKVRHKKRVTNPLDPVCKWKILENLRRSLNAPAIFLLLILSFTFFSGPVYLYILTAGIAVFYPFLAEAASRIVQLVKEKNIYTPDIWSELKNIFFNVLYSYTFLAYEAYLMADAIIRTILRLITGKNLLSWVTAEISERAFRPTLAGYIRKMWIAPVMAAVFFLVSFTQDRDFIAAFLLALAWCGSPLLAYGSGQVTAKDKYEFSSSAKKDLMRVARETWDFYDYLVNPTTNYLPPDNYQEEPYLGIAPRTSPTNIGMYIMACMSAHDLGFICTLDLYERLEKCMKTIEQMEKWNGHLYNWYDINTLRPLRPAYVSAVDSGNLAGCLMCVNAGLREVYAKSIISPQRINGIKCSLRLASDIAGKRSFSDKLVNELVSRLSNIKDIRSFYGELVFIEKALHNQDAPFAQRVKRDIMNSLNEISEIMPYLSVINDMPDLSYDRDLNSGVGEIIEILEASVSVESVIDNSITAGAMINKLISRYSNVYSNDSFSKWIQRLKSSVASAVNNARKRIRQRNKLCSRLDMMAKVMDFAPLYDNKAGLFYIGYNTDTKVLSDSHYDLFASEARLCGLIAIAKGDVPVEHWFRMSRPIRRAGDMKLLMSWTGTMFEYLMPSLIMKTFDYTLLDQAQHTAVVMQKRHASAKHIPWGVSESCFYSLDTMNVYQYKAFGVPGMGMKAGLGDDMVVSPYSTALALGVLPHDAYKNLQQIIHLGGEGKYGLYEAIDFTADRVGKSKYKIVKNYMAHHQGMILISLNNALNENINIERFHSLPEIKAVELLLQERVPQYVSISEVRPEKEEALTGTREQNAQRIIKSPDVLPMETQILSNGTYTVMINAAGSGYSQFDGYMLSRWKEDMVTNDRGMYIYIKNMSTGDIWSATQQPFNIKNSRYKVVLSEEAVTFLRKDGNIETETKIFVSPEENAEIRSITLHNDGETDALVELTSYMELALNRYMDDISHRTYSNLFISTQYFPEYCCLTAARHTGSGIRPVAVHFIIENGKNEYETDRARFIGRNQNASMPKALMENKPLSNTTGSVIDPCFSLRRRILIPKGGTATLSFVLAAAYSIDDARRIASEMREPGIVQRSRELAASGAKLLLKHFNMRPWQAIIYQRLASRLIYRYETLSGGKKSLLWPLGISGDRPIAVVCVNSAQSLHGARIMAMGHSYLRMKGFAFDYVFIVEEEQGYFQPLRDKLNEIAAGQGSKELGRLYVINSNAYPPEIIDNLKKVARVIIDASRPIGQQLYAGKPIESGHWIPVKPGRYEESVIPVNGKVEFYNGFGMFADNGREYLILHRGDRHTPMPWANVLANEHFGSIVTESGGGYTWAENSRQNKL
ncbi:MAG TPA: glucoamylase family protein, partial [Clostridia bacterium]|nr:glucoamylase family protein [Clostridia bacterium]